MTLAERFNLGTRDNLKLVLAWWRVHRCKIASRSTHAACHARHLAAAYRTALKSWRTAGGTAWRPTLFTNVEWPLRWFGRRSLGKLAYELPVTGPTVSTEVSVWTTRLPTTEVSFWTTPIATTAVSFGATFTAADDLIAGTTTLT